MNKLFTFGLFCFFTLVVSIATTSCFKERPIDTGARTRQLANHTWVYYEYFKDFNNPSSRLVWKINRERNTYDLAQNQVKFNGDFTCIEIDDQGDTLSGTWSYLDGGKRIEIRNNAGTFIATVKDLTSDRYEWLDDNGNYGVMIPIDAQTNITGDISYCLTSGKWTYDEYFIGYGNAEAELVYKYIKYDNKENLDGYSLTFNEDGSYSEADAAGNTATGIWSLPGNGTFLKMVDSTGATYINTIKLLDVDRFEWLSRDGSTYAEMDHRY